MVQTYNFDIASSSTKHVNHHVTALNKDYEMTNFATGTALSIALDAAEKSNTAGFHGESNVFETENKSAKATFTIIQGKPQDITFQAEHNEKLDNQGDTFTFYDTATGERVNITGCVIESEPTFSMVNNVQTVQWVWLVKSFQRSFDGVNSTKDALN